MNKFFFMALFSFLSIIVKAETSNYIEDENELRQEETIPLVNEEHNAKDDYRNFLITPSVSLLKLPHQFDGAIEVEISQLFGIKYSQSLKTHGVVDNNSIDLDNQSIALRTYPHRGSWFLGLGYGHHEVKVQRTDVVNGFDTTTYAHIKSNYLMPTTGFKWVYSSGFTIGMEVGWIFSLDSSTNIVSDQDYNLFVTQNSDYSQHRKDAEDAISKYVKNGTVSVCLLELGWTF